MGHSLVTIDEIIAADRVLLESLGPTHGITDALIDLRGAVEFDATRGKFAALIDIDRQLSTVLPTLRMAIVAPKDLAYGLGRMYNPPSAWTVEVFRTRADAMRWLNRSRHTQSSPDASRTDIRHDRTMLSATSR